MTVTCDQTGVGRAWPKTPALTGRKPWHSLLFVTATLISYPHSSFASFLQIPVAVSVVSDKQHKKANKLD